MIIKHTKRSIQYLSDGVRQFFDEKTPVVGNEHKIGDGCLTMGRALQ